MIEAVECSAPVDARHRVLVVDDERLIRWSLSETLRHQGYAVVEAGDARNAISEANDAPESFGVVLLDVRLPDSTDLTLLTYLRLLMSDARIIVMTAHGSPELAQCALDLGAYRVLDKPFGMSELAEIVDQASDSYVAAAGNPIGERLDEESTDSTGEFY
jgi:two-component system, NtrC family, response regulator AtoC